MQEILEKIPKNFDEITLKELKELSSLEKKLQEEAFLRKKNIDLEKNKLLKKISELEIEKNNIDKEVNDFSKKIFEIKNFFSEIPNNFASNNFASNNFASNNFASKLMESKDHYADVYGIKFKSPLIKSYKESINHPLIPCTLLLNKETFYIIYFPTLGQISALREPYSLFTKKSKHYSVAHKAIDNPNCLMDANHNYSYFPFSSSQWKILEKDFKYFRNFNIQKVDGSIKEYGHPFVFNDCRTILKNSQIASNAEISFCFDLHAQIYFLMYLSSRTPLASSFILKPK